MSFKERLKSLEEVLGEDVVDLKKLKSIVFHGLPGDSRYRSLVWKLLLNYLPLDKSTWEGHLLKKRSEYAEFVQDLKQKPENFDHPLNPDSNSSWQQFFALNETLLQIHKDVRRLLPEINFFQIATPYPNGQVISGDLDRLHERVKNTCLGTENVIKHRLGLITAKESKGRGMEDEEKDPTGRSEYHWEVVERILFIYAKLNPGQGYVQGMNEIIGPIYYTLANDQDKEQTRHAEADTFYLFTNLMGEIRDFFIRSLDNSKSGIKSMMDNLFEKLKLKDEQIYNLLVTQDIHPQYFSFRWITLLLSQEFALPEVIRIWDTLFADPNRFQFLTDICIAMILEKRRELLSSDFSTNMKLLQNYPPMDVKIILTRASTHSSN